MRKLKRPVKNLCYRLPVRYCKSWRATRGVWGKKEEVTPSPFLSRPDPAGYWLSCQLTEILEQAMVPIILVLMSVEDKNDKTIAMITVLSTNLNLCIVSAEI